MLIVIATASFIAQRCGDNPKMTYRLEVYYRHNSTGENFPPGPFPPQFSATVVRPKSRGCSQGCSIDNSGASGAWGSSVAHEVHSCNSHAQLCQKPSSVGMKSPKCKMSCTTSICQGTFCSYVLQGTSASRSHRAKVQNSNPLMSFHFDRLPAFHLPCPSRSELVQGH